MNKGLNWGVTSSLWTQHFPNPRLRLRLVQTCFLHCWIKTFVFLGLSVRWQRLPGPVMAKAVPTPGHPRHQHDAWVGRNAPSRFPPHDDVWPLPKTAPWGWEPVSHAAFISLSSAEKSRRWRARLCRSCPAESGKLCCLWELWLCLLFPPAAALQSSMRCWTTVLMTCIWTGFKVSYTSLKVPGLGGPVCTEHSLPPHHMICCQLSCYIPPFCGFSNLSASRTEPP